MDRGLVRFAVFKLMNVNFRHFCLAYALGQALCIFSQRCNNIPSIVGTGNLRYVHNVVLANLIEGNYTMSDSNFVFLPEKPTWLMDSMVIDHVDIDTIMHAFHSVVIYMNINNENRFEIQCSKSKYILNQWKGRLSAFNKGMRELGDEWKDEKKYETIIRGSTFGSIIFTPVRFPAFVVLGPEGLSIQSPLAPFSLMRATHYRHQIKKIRIVRDRIRVKLYEGGRFSIQCIDDPSILQDILIWYNRL